MSVLTFENLKNTFKHLLAVRKTLNLRRPISHLHQLQMLTTRLEFEPHRGQKGSSAIKGFGLNSTSLWLSQCQFNMSTSSYMDKFMQVFTSWYFTILTSILNVFHMSTVSSSKVFSCQLWNINYEWPYATCECSKAHTKNRQIPVKENLFLGNNQFVMGTLMPTVTSSITVTVSYCGTTVTVFTVVPHSLSLLWLYKLVHYKRTDMFKF